MSELKVPAVVLAGMGGYGHYYLQDLLKLRTGRSIRLAGIVDPGPDQAPLYGEILKQGIPVYGTLDAFYRTGGEADLAVISSPPYLHAEQTVTALQNGSHVLCEKPLALTVQDVDRVIRTGRQTSRWVMVGFQWSFSRAIQDLKRDLCRGLFGAPRRFKTICLWPRDSQYYSRNHWAGKLKNNHTWILDSPASNAMAHFLHNLLFLAGSAMLNSARPAGIGAETYRCHPIQSYDTVACRIQTEPVAEILFFATHAGQRNMEPVFQLECDEAVITRGAENGRIVACGTSGRVKKYGSPDDDPQFKKLTAAIGNIRDATALICTAATVRPHVLCVNGIQESRPVIKQIPGDRIQRTDRTSWVEGLDDLLYNCYRTGRMPAETGVPWAEAGEWVSFNGYDYFPDTADNRFT